MVHRFLLPILGSALVACSGGDSTGPDPSGNGGAYTLAISPAQPSVAQGGSVGVTVTINRTGGFDDVVTLSVLGAPAGLAATLSAAATTGGSVTLTLTAGAALAAGTFDLTLRGVAAGLQDRTVPVSVTVTATGGGGGGGGAGRAVLDFSGCVASQRPVWFAFQDGTGPWTHVPGAGNVYEFDIAAARGGYAWATLTGGQSIVSVVLWSRAELTTMPIVQCSPVATKSVTGSVAGLAAGDQANIWMGSGAGFASSGTPAFTMNAVHDGVQDLFAWRSHPTGANPDRGFVRRDQNIAANGSVGVLDFNGAESFAPASANLTIAGLVAGELATHGMNYYSAATCRFAGFYQAPASAAAVQTMRGVPAALQRPTDFHQVGVTALATGTARVIQEWFRLVAARTVTLPPTMPVPTITALGGAYTRLQAAFQLPAEYSTALLLYSQGTRSATVTASLGWLGGHAATLAMPDFAAVSGWNPTWAPAAGGAVPWIIQGTGSNFTSANLCQDGGRVISAQRMGNY